MYPLTAVAPPAAAPRSESEGSVTSGIDDRELASRGTPVPPAAPHTLIGVAGEDSIALRWQQEGDVDFWTIYIDPLDGGPTATYRTTRPRFEIADLPFGDHEIGVVSWRDGLPCPGSGVFMMVSVLGAPVGGPDQPADIDVVAKTTSADASWAPAQVADWDVRLVAEDWTVEQQVDGLPSPWVSFSQLQPDTVYGVQARARGNDGAVSRWSVTAWLRTRKVACGHGDNLSAGL